jgi:hypothetical protein
MAMKDPPHPGLSVRHDCLEPLGLSVSAAAEELGVSRKQLSGIVNGRAGIAGDGDPARQGVRRWCRDLASPAGRLRSRPGDAPRRPDQGRAPEPHGGMTREGRRLRSSCLDRRRRIRPARGDRYAQVWVARRRLRAPRLW